MSGGADRFYDDSDSGKAKQFVQMVRSCSFRDGPSMRRMPISVQNEMPHIRFPVGLQTHRASLLGLYDTGAAVTTGLYSYHKQLCERRPDLVHSFEEFDGDNPFEPIKLEGAITHPSAYEEKRHGALSAVVGYHSPFTKKGASEQFLVCVALGVDMAVNTIFGLPFITDLSLELRLLDARFLAHALQQSFRVFFRPTERADPVPPPKRSAPALTQSAEALAPESESASAEPPAKRVQFAQDALAVRTPTAMAAALAQFLPAPDAPDSSTPVGTSAPSRSLSPQSAQIPPAPAVPPA